jgi:restriction endonuclease S subunit
MKLSEIGDLRIGLVLSRKIYEEGQTEKFDYNAITLSSSMISGIIDRSKCDTYSAAKPVKKRYLTAENDVLIRLSEPNTATFIDKKLSGLVVPSQFVVLKVKQKGISPEFIAWALNSIHVKKQIEQYKSGTSLKTISAADLGEVEITILPYDEQDKIIKINRLYQKESELLSIYKKNRESLYKGVLNKIYGGIKL